MAYNIDEQSEPLRTLHEDVVRFLERQGIALKQRNVWSYVGPSPTAHLDLVVLEFLHVASAQSLASWPLANEVVVEAARAIEALDALLPHLAPVLEMVDQIAGVEFAPGAPFVQRSVQSIKRLAPSIHRTTTRGVEFRVGLVELLNMLSAFVPTEAKIGVSEEHVATYYAYRLHKAGVPLELIADVIGLFDEISPRLPKSDRLDQQDKKVAVLAKRLTRFNAKLRE